MASKAQPAAESEECELGTIVPSSGLVPASGLVPSDSIVRRFNALNAQIIHGMPRVALATDILQSQRPFLIEMQALLSQRPIQPHRDSDFTMLQRVKGKTVRMATPVGSPDQLPTWTHWVTEYARAIDYSVRHIRRVVSGRPFTKTVEQCRWSVTEHNKMLSAVSLLFDLAAALEAGADTSALLQEVDELREGVPEDWFDHGYRPVRVPRRRRAARHMTRVEE